MLAVNLPGQCTQLRLQLLILLDILPTRHGHLDQNHFIAELGVVVEKRIEALQLLR